MKNLLLLLMFFACMGCNRPYKEMSGDVANIAEVMELSAAMEPAPSKEVSPAKEITQKVVKTGGINFQSGNIEEDYKKIREALPRFKAYIENENQSRSTQRISYSLTIRVPANTYDTLYSSLTSLAFKLDNKYSNIEDVTERYYDLKTRIKNKQALEQRYIELLKKATAIKDILEIERNLNQVRTEIENLQGQFNYLSKQVNFSTINLAFYEVLPYVYDSSQRKGFGARILSALDDGWQGFLFFLVGLTTLWPFLIIIIGLIYLIRRLRRKWKKKKS